MDNTSMSIMFEEIKQMLKKLSDKFGNNSQNMTNAPDFSDIKSHINQSNEELSSKLEDIERVIVQPTVKKVHHRVSIDIKSSSVFITILGLSLFLITSLALNYKLKQVNDGLSDNDLKYRYINMQGEVNGNDLLNLDAIFTYNRNKDSIYIISQKVKTYERLVKEHAERIERARFNTDEAERLQSEVEKVKSK